MKKRIPLFLILALLASTAGGHQPRLVKDDLVEISNPEVSQAFYGELKGEPAQYRIRSAAPFRLYVGLLLPDLQGVRKEVSAEIFRLADGRSERIGFLDGANFAWTPYFEKFAGDHYLWGPEFGAPDSGKGEAPRGREVAAGVYGIRVFNPGNRGKYSLVVGDVERFPLPEVLKAAVAVPKIKRAFFEKSVWSAYLNRFTLAFAAVFLVIAALLGIATTWIVHLVTKARGRVRIRT